MKTIAESANDFRDLRTKKSPCVYVDKTAHFHRLITDPGRTLFFIARPRRFGKSLMITTFKYIFQGKRELFEGLDIAKTDYDWQVSPVIHIDFGLAAAARCEDFKLQLPTVMKLALSASGFTYDDSLPPAANFLNAIVWHHAQGRPCVVLIDEYDDPVAKALAHLEEAEKVRDELANIYGKIKGNTDKIRFLMITGVSKFTKMSVFSALSNLTDISNEPEYADMLGYTEEELDEYFAEHMAAHAKVMGLTDEQYRAELKRWFNGYRFTTKNPVTVYNPVSIGLTFAGQDDEFKGTWTKTGRPSMLMNFMRREGVVHIDPYRTISAMEKDFDVSDLSNLNEIGMLYQTGYLTIDSYSSGLYKLRVPDEEVRQDVAALVVGALADRDAQWTSTLGLRLRACEWDDFFVGLKALYAKLPYGSREQGERKSEFSYQRPLCVLLAAQGFRYNPEVYLTGGRSDIVAEHPAGVWIFELKVDDTAEHALEQIRTRDYVAAYLADGRPVYAIGLSFDSKTRQLKDLIAEEIRQ